MSQEMILYGNYAEDGVQLSSFMSSGEFSGHLAEGALHILLNIEGSGILLGQSLRVSLSPSTMVVFHRAAGEKLNANRIGKNNQFLILSVTTNWIIRTFGSRQEALHPILRGILANTPKDTTALGKVRSMSLSEKEIAAELVEPPVANAAKDFWYLAKVLEILTLHLFASSNLSDAEPFCCKVKRNTRERAERSISWIKEHLDQPLDLNSMATHIGCAPHYLSRQFKKSTGMTLKQKHRELRIDHAAKLLEAGDYNVTEAALEVGYNSLSHFSKAFHEVKGCLPSEFTSN
jgi:AraC-like DNA-binding protein